MKEFELHRLKSIVRKYDDELPKESPLKHSVRVISYEFAPGTSCCRVFYDTIMEYVLLLRIIDHCKECGLFLHLGDKNIFIM